MNFKTKDGKFIPQLSQTDERKLYEIRDMLRSLMKADIDGAGEAAVELVKLMESLGLPEQRQDAYERARAKQGRQTLET